MNPLVKLRIPADTAAPGVLAGSVFNSHRTQIVELAVKSRLPALYFRSEFVEDGGLMSYATDITDLDRRAATYEDKILKGTKPARPAKEV